MSTSLPALDCLCASFRRATRALTQHYEEALRPLALTPTQFTILQVLARTGPIPQGRLGEILAMDSTTLTRTLEIMSAQGWIAKSPGDDRRERRVSLALKGKNLFQSATPRWEKVQSDLRRRLGAGPWDQLLQFTNQVTTTVTQGGDRG